MPFKPALWDPSLVTPQGDFMPTAGIRLLHYKEALANGLIVFNGLESRMLAEWALVDDRLVVVKPNVSAGLPLTKKFHRMLECEIIAWRTVERLKFKHFNEAYLVEWPAGENWRKPGLRLISPVVAGMRDAATLTKAERRSLLLRHPHAAAEFVAQKIITGDYDDRPQNYVVTEDGDALVRIDYGCAHAGNLKPIAELSRLMECVGFAELARNPRFIERLGDIASTADAVPKADWQSIVAHAETLDEHEKTQIVLRSRLSGSRIRRLIAAHMDNPIARRSAQSARKSAGTAVEALRL